jgi:lactoylglutathione lyase
MELIHTCYRVTDPERSIAFYEALGLEKRRELPIRDEAVNYFLGVPGRELPVEAASGRPISDRTDREDANSR